MYYGVAVPWSLFRWSEWPHVLRPLFATLQAWALRWWSTARWNQKTSRHSGDIFDCALSSIILKLNPLRLPRNSSLSCDLSKLGGGTSKSDCWLCLAVVSSLKFHAIVWEYWLAAWVWGVGCVSGKESGKTTQSEPEAKRSPDDLSPLQHNTVDQGSGKNLLQDVGHSLSGQRPPHFWSSVIWSFAKLLFNTSCHWELKVFCYNWRGRGLTRDERGRNLISRWES